MLMKLMPTLAIRKIPAAVRVKIRRQRTPLVSASITVVPLISFEGPLLGRVETGCRRFGCRQRRSDHAVLGLLILSLSRSPRRILDQLIHSAPVLSLTHRRPRLLGF